MTPTESIADCVYSPSHRTRRGALTTDDLSSVTRREAERKNVIKVSFFYAGVDLK
jgi:hypothetical protein